MSITGVTASCSSADAPAAVGALGDPPTLAVPATDVPRSEPTTAPVPSTSAAPLTVPIATPVPVTVRLPPDVTVGTAAVVGDSLALSASDLIEAELLRVGIGRVVIDARESRRMVSGSTELPAGVSAIAGILDGLGDDESPDLWVIALGTNDIASGADLESFRADVEATLAALPADAPVVWVDLWIRDRRADVVAANLELRDALTRREAPSSAVSWYAAAAAPGNIIGDGVHLTDDGRQRFAREIATAIVETYVFGRAG